MKEAADSALAEMQGLYGTFSFPERLLQKIWNRREFDVASARTVDGRPVRVLHAGRWNRLGGPDFMDARLLLAGGEITGDVELHLHARDWEAHAHADDPAYANVVLHVVLFPGTERVTRGAGGREIPVLCLLPLLHHGLEEYAADEAMEQLAGRPLHFAQEALGALSNEMLNTTLAAHAEKRWADKVRYARARIARLGWEGACHHVALEVLGYRFNRAPMLSVATEYPLSEWAKEAVDPEAVFEGMGDRWSLHGVRPLNHPKLRLRQYSEWCRARPDWPNRLREHPHIRALAVESDACLVGPWRRAAALKVKREDLLDDICAGEVGANRWDNLVCDGFMPLITAETGLVLHQAWFGWYAGDAPGAATRVLRTLGVFGGRDRPVAQGPIQGILGWVWAHEERLRTA